MSCVLTYYALESEDTIIIIISLDHVSNKISVRELESVGMHVHVDSNYSSESSKHWKDKRS